MIFIYSIFLIFVSIYSYSLIDVNLTLFNNKIWEIFREKIVYLGYYQRNLNSFLYILIVIFLFLFSLYFIKKFNRFNAFKLSLIIGFILLFAYPFLSHDLFNYIFDARILTFYHKIPYFFRPQDFPHDSWLRFMHWTHRYYPYGPSFLLFSLIPSILSFNKFILTFFSFKLMFVIFYVLAVYSLNKINKKWSMIFATHPLILIEGLINSHNDLIATSLGIIGLYLLISKGKNFLSRIVFLLSGGIKFNTLPFILFSKERKMVNNLVFIIFVIPMIYLLLTREIQPWYFLSFFAFLAFFGEELTKFNFFSAGLLFSSYFFIRYGNIDNNQFVLKNSLIFIFLTLNVFYLFIKSAVVVLPSKKTKIIILGVIFLIAVITRFINIGESAFFSTAQTNDFNVLYNFVVNHKITFSGFTNSVYYFVLSLFYLINKNPYLITYTVPGFFLLTITIILLIKKIGFFEKTFFLLLVISSKNMLYYSRFLAKENFIYIIIYFFIFFIIAIILAAMFKKGLWWKYFTLLIILIFYIFNLIKYFSSAGNVYAINKQVGTVKAILENENIVERNNQIEKKNIKRINKIKLEVYPNRDNIKPLDYLLKVNYGITISENEGNKYWICYFDKCPIKKDKLKLMENVLLIYDKKNLAGYYFKWE